MRVHLKIICCYVLSSFFWVSAGSYEDFFHAINFDRPNEVERFIARGIDPNTPSEKGIPALMYAIQSDSPKSALLLAMHPRTRIDFVNRLGETPLMLAALHNQLEVCQQLIKRGADVNRPGWTPLHYAATRGHLRIMRLLIDENAYIDSESENGTTPLMIAAHSAPAIAVKFLLEEGADPNLRNHGQTTALDLAIRADREQSILYLRAFMEAWEMQEMRDREAAKNKTR